MTDSYSFTISQRVPVVRRCWKSSYVGNQSRDLLNQSGVGSDINLVPVGAMLSSKNGGADPNRLNANNFRPLLGFAGLPLATHNLYANYNSLQVKYLRTKGRAVINMNYTFGKAMGIVSSTLDSFNLNNDYGVQSTQPHAHLQRRLLRTTSGSFTRNKFAGGVRQRLAGLRRHADSERRQPDRPARPELRTGAEQLQDSRHDVQRQQRRRCWGRRISRCIRS